MNILSDRRLFDWLLIALVIISFLMISIIIYFLHSAATLWSEMTAFISSLTLVVGLYQIHNIRSGNKIHNSLIACERYDLDPVLTECLRNIKEINDNPCANASDRIGISLDLATILNYLDGIAIGIEQRIYDHDIVYDHLYPIIDHYVTHYIINEKWKKEFGLTLGGDYDRLIRLHQKFRESPTRFQG
jgi:hypothetical protein